MYFLFLNNLFIFWSLAGFVIKLLFNKNKTFHWCNEKRLAIIVPLPWNECHFSPLPWNECFRFKQKIRIILFHLIISKHYQRWKSPKKSKVVRWSSTPHNMSISAPHSQQYIQGPSYDFLNKLVSSFRQACEDIIYLIIAASTTTSLWINRFRKSSVVGFNIASNFPCYISLTIRDSI